MLDKAAAQSVDWTLKDTDLLRKNTNRMATSWDTMGWIFYREGKLEDAIKFLEAAWSNMQDPVIGTHLGDVWMALKNPTEAYNVYEVVSVIRGGADIKSKLGAAKAAGGRSTLKDKKTVLQSLRTILVGPSHGVSAAAEYRLLISHDKVEAVEPTGEKTVPGGAEMLQKMTFPQLFPEATSARLLYTAVLNCHEQVCELVLEAH
jgi:tetratricopeptide (TPR) repeat protein